MWRNEAIGSVRRHCFRASPLLQLLVVVHGRNVFGTAKHLDIMQRRPGGCVWLCFISRNADALPQIEINTNMCACVPSSGQLAVLVVVVVVVEAPTAVAVATV